MATKEEMQKMWEARIHSEQRAMKRITNDDLVCKDCLVRFDDSVKFGNTSKCETYPVTKPNHVLLGGKCDEYVQE